MLSIVFDSVPVNQKKTGTEQSVFSADIEQMALLSQNKCTELFSLASIVLQNKCTELLNELISLGDIVLQNELCCSLKICLLDGHSQRAVLALHLV